MPRGNPSPKLAITIDPAVHESIQAAAARDGVSISAWMTNAAREALQRRAGLAAIAHLAARGQRRFLVVCPASVQINWLNETRTGSSGLACAAAKPLKSFLSVGESIMISSGGIA